MEEDASAVPSLPDTVISASSHSAIPEYAVNQVSLKKSFRYAFSSISPYFFTILINY